MKRLKKVWRFRRRDASSPTFTPFSQHSRQASLLPSLTAHHHENIYIASRSNNLNLTRGKIRPFISLQGLGHLGTLKHKRLCQSWSRASIIHIQFCMHQSSFRHLQSKTSYGQGKPSQSNNATQCKRKPTPPPHHIVSVISSQHYITPSHPSHYPSPPSLNPHSRLRALLPLLVLLRIIILPRVRDLILQNLDELVKHDRQDRSNSRPSPVDPVLRVERARNDARPEAACGVERAACVVDADELGDEEREADADGGNEGRWVRELVCGGRNGI
jgi:hypothetical protein